LEGRKEETVRMKRVGKKGCMVGRMGKWSWIVGEGCDEGVGCLQRMKRRSWKDGKKT
jgi:hypothetical protein